MTTLVMKDESVFKRFVVKFVSCAFLSIIFALGNDVYASVQPETHGEIDSKFQMKDVKQFLEQKIRSLNTTELIVFGFIVILAFEILNFGSGHLSDWITLQRIPVKGKHLDSLGFRDKLFIAFSIANTAPFTYFYARLALHQQNILWELNEMTIWNTLVPLPTLFIVFDFFYTLLHWFLHLKSVYPYIHKHHHQQKAPSRANIDAVNVHPIEFVLGEYNHLLSLYICSTYCFHQMHVVCAIMFLVVGGLLAGLNHTRHDAKISIPWRNSVITIYDSKDHDVHHRIPQSNYGQYSMFWDHVFGSYRAYDFKTLASRNS